MKKKIMSFTALLVTMTIVFTTFAGFASAMNFNTNVDLYSEAAYMVNLDTGEVVVSINASEERVPASLTKIMTCVVILDMFKDDLDALETTKASGGIDVFEELWGTNCSTADIQMNEEVTYIDLLHALMIPSACEAANILAINSAGSISAFVKLMNAKAVELGMTNTHFSNTHGLFPEDNYTSCEDIAKLCEYAIETYPLFCEIVSKPNYQMAATSDHPDGTTIVNTNKMLQVGSEYYYSYAKGIKTGFLDEAGRCLASYAEMDGMTYLIVTMGAPSEDSEGNSVMYNCIDHAALYKWAFSQLEFTEVLSSESEITDIDVGLGDGRTTVNLRPAKTYECLWPKAQTVSESDSEEIAAYKESIEKITDIRKKISLNENVVAPVKEGDVLGQVELTYEGQTLAVIDLVATSSVERSTVKEKTEVAKSFTSSVQFKIVIAVVAAVVIIYFIIFFVIVNKSMKNKKKRKSRR